MFHHVIKVIPQNNLVLICSESSLELDTRTSDLPESTPTPQNNNATFMAEDKSLGFSLTLIVVFFIIVAHLCKIGSSQLCY